VKEYWTGASPDYRHIRGTGRWYNENKWYDIGYAHRKLIRTHYPDFQRGQIVEWGIGGGANITGLYDLASEYAGIDINSHSLIEAEKIATELGVPFISIQIDPAENFKDVPTTLSADLFISTAVIQHFPSDTYLRRFLRTARKITKQGGYLLLQSRQGTRPKRVNVPYGKWAVQALSHKASQFRKELEDAKFDIVAFESGVLAPDYDYWILRRP
jgi:cyclopropane fatty-acyl-phospholipid synthase-like methyltransferase